MSTPHPAGGIENALPDSAFDPPNQLATTLFIAGALALQEAKKDDEWPDVAATDQDAHRFVIPYYIAAVPEAHLRVQAAVERIKERRRRTGRN